jgi:hypothetical protein
MVSIKFKTFGATSAGGSFGPGDILRCDEKIAKHLVEEAQCAVYMQAPQPEPIAQVEVGQMPFRRTRKNNKD